MTSHASSAAGDVTHSAAPAPGAAEAVVVIRQWSDLFADGEVDPTAAFDSQVLGHSAIEQLRRQFLLHWPRRQQTQTLVIRVPQTVYEAAAREPGIQALAQQVVVALGLYCNARLEQNARTRVLVRRDARRQMPLTLLLIGVAGLLLALNGMGLRVRLTWLPPVAAGVLLFAAVVSIWDVVWALIFEQTPTTLDSRAHRWMSSLAVRIEPWALEPAPAAAGDRDAPPHPR